MISLIAGSITALISGDALFVFVLCSALSLGAVLLTRRYGWYSVLLFATVLVYLTHLIWALGDPVMGNPVHQFSGDHGFGDPMGRVNGMGSFLMGINNRNQLAQLERVFQARQAQGR